MIFNSVLLKENNNLDLTIAFVLKKYMDEKSTNYNKNFRNLFAIAQTKEIGVSRFIGFNIVSFHQSLEYFKNLLNGKIGELTMKEQKQRIQLLFSEVMTDYVSVKSELKPIIDKYTELIERNKFWSWEMLYWHFEQLEKLDEFQNLPEKKLFTLIFLFGLDTETFTKFFTENFKTSKANIDKKVKEFQENKEMRLLNEDILQLSYSFPQLDDYRKWQDVFTKEILEKTGINRDIYNKARKTEFTELEKRPYVYNSLTFRQIQERMAKRNLRDSVKRMKGGELY